MRVSVSRTNNNNNKVKSRAKKPKEDIQRNNGQAVSK